MKVAPVSADLLIKLALVAGAGIGAYLLYRKLTGAAASAADSLAALPGKIYDQAAAYVGEVVDSVVALPGKAADAVKEIQKTAAAGSVDVSDPLNSIWNADNPMGMPNDPSIIWN